MDLSEFLLAWRTAALPDREVIDALVHPAHAGPSPALAAALERWPGTSYWSDEPDGRHLVLTPERARQHQVASVRLVGPIGGAGPAFQRRGQRWGGPGMRRMYKRVNHFPVRERCRPPGEQELAQVHRRT